jgi:hypothetical protein
VNGVNVDTINNEQEIAYNPMASLYDAMESIGFFNVSGNVFGANGANMTINKSLGSLFKMGSNYDTAPTDNPHVRTNAATSGGIFQYRFSDGTSGSLTETNIDPDNLDDGAGGLTAVGNNQWSVQRIYIFTSNNIKIQRGVSSYSSSDAAIQGITTEPYITETSLTANALFRGWLIIKKGATVLNGVDAIFLSSGKFGESGGSVGSGSTTTLQAAYDNSSDSEIVIPSGAANAFSLEADTDGAEIVQDWKDETQTVKASMTGDGNLAVVDVNGVALTTAGAATNFLNETGAYSVPPGGVGSADIGPRSVVATAGAAWGFVGDELVWATSDGNSVASYWSYTVQKDYVSGGTLDIWIRATGTGDASPVVADMTAWIDNVVDATINTLSIIPSVDSTWEKITITFGSTLAIGDVINLQMDTDTSVNPGTKLIQIKAMIFNYN